jgi:hypothetical protein
MASCSEVAESSADGNRRVADPQRFGVKCLREPETEVAGAARRIFGQLDLVPKWLKSIDYLWRHISLSRSERLPCRIRGKSSGRIGQQDLRFVRRGVSYCSAVAGGFLALPSPSLGVSSLDLGRSRKVSGPFLLVFGVLHPAVFAGTYSAAAR